MSRIQTVYAISDILSHCASCQQRKSLMKTYGATFSKIDGYCNRVCPVGGLLQLRGKELPRKGAV